MGRPPVSAVIPPLIFGTGTFNYQFVGNPFTMDAPGLVLEALESGIRAFDTSPYYGPSEEILGKALDAATVKSNFSRDELFLITKCGRLHSYEFDYSKEWVRKSVSRSLKRLGTKYLDLVYCHDVEFVSKGEVLEAVKELRRIRDEEATIKYVGISGYPLPVLSSLAHFILQETGEPLDAVMSYAHFTLQNTLLSKTAIEELEAAGVGVVPSASPLAMGLLRKEGVPVGGAGDWHPASNELRTAIRRASHYCDQHEERLELVALRYALQNWTKLGAAVGSSARPDGKRLGISVVGLTAKEEIVRLTQVWRGVLDGLESTATAKDSDQVREHELALACWKETRILAEGIQERIGEFMNQTWESPPKGFVNKTHGHH